MTIYDIKYRTQEEQIELYLKCTKRQLAEMLTEANKHLKGLGGVVPETAETTVVKFLQKEE